MTSFDNLSAKQKQQATIHRDVRAICTETCHFLGLDITKAAMDVVAEIVFHKLAVYGKDVEAFAKHAKRTVVNGEDVKLLVRRNPSLTSHLNEHCPTAPGSSVKDKRRKSQPASKQPANKEPVKERASLLPACHLNNIDSLQSAGGIRETNTTGSKPEEEDMVVDQTIDLTFD